VRLSMKDSRYKVPPSKRKFGGKVYNYFIIGTKSEVKGDAQRWRGRGFSVRIVPYGIKYAVYTRRG
jgi:hypothetical protein